MEVFPYRTKTSFEGSIVRRKMPGQPSTIRNDPRVRTELFAKAFNRSVNDLQLSRVRPPIAPHHKHKNDDDVIKALVPDRQRVAQKPKHSFGGQHLPIVNCHCLDDPVGAKCP